MFRLENVADTWTTVSRVVEEEDIYVAVVDWGHVDNNVAFRPDVQFAAKEFARHSNDITPTGRKKFEHVAKYL
eukprot:8125144-Lingulodinium_polyedra.AAC.1